MIGSPDPIVLMLDSTLFKINMAFIVALFFYHIFSANRLRCKVEEDNKTDFDLLQMTSYASWLNAKKSPKNDNKQREFIKRNCLSFLITIRAFEIVFALLFVQLGFSVLLRYL